jgi:hypothetical protein
MQSSIATRQSPRRLLAGRQYDQLNSNRSFGPRLGILDDGVAKLGSLIGSPKEWLIGLGLHVIRLRESNDVPYIIDALCQM